jgi:predicted  nucleic acid-binding Zn-ribbon protein
MKADPADQERLLELQELDTHIRQVHSKAKSLPEAAVVTELEASLTDSKAAQRDALTAVDELKAEMARAESDVKLVEQRIAKDSEHSQHTSSAKDAQGLEHEIQSLRERLAMLEEVELGVIERLEAAEAELSGADQAMTELQSRLDEAKQALDAAKAALEADNQATSATRQALVDGLPEELVALYERQRERYGFGASLLQRGISSASGVALTESDLHQVRQAAPDDVVLCPDSNAILVRTAESGI